LRPPPPPPLFPYTTLFRSRQTIVADLIYTAPDGRRIAVQGQLSPADGVLYIGQTIPLRIDPSDPERWTDRTEPPPWLAEMTAVRSEEHTSELQSRSDLVCR